MSFDLPKESDISDFNLSFEAREREIFFDQIIIDGILESFVETMDDLGFNQDIIDDFKKSIEKMEPGVSLKILSIPREILSKRLASYLNKINSGEMKCQDLVKELLESAEKNGFTIGFHTSSKNIVPKITGGNTEWDIVGTDIDDRDDVSRAYYSLDYKNLYLKKNPKFIYAVRVKVGHDPGYKIDESNAWGRASRLSIIAKFDLPDIDEGIKYRIDEFRKTKKAV